MAIKKTTKKTTKKKATKKKTTRKATAADEETSSVAQVDVGDVARASAEIVAEGGDEPKTAKKTATKKKAVKKKTVKKKAATKKATTKKAVKKKTVKKKAATKETAAKKTTRKKATKAVADETEPPTEVSDDAAPIDFPDEAVFEPAEIAPEPVDEDARGEADAQVELTDVARDTAPDHVEEPIAAEREDRDVVRGGPTEEADAATMSEVGTQESKERPDAPPSKRRRRRGRSKTRQGEGPQDETRQEPQADAEQDAASPTAPPPAREPDEGSRDGERRDRRGRRRRGGKRARRADDRRRDAEPTEVEREDTDDEALLPKEGGGSREMLINVSAGDECRIAVLSGGRLEELFMERSSSLSHVGNIYKGRVTNVEPSIQAVFVDFGLPKNGFLHISDVQPQYFPDHKGEGEDVGRKIPRHARPPIQQCFRRGQEVIVQIIKEGVGTKGPTLTTYLSVPGRFLVMMPGMNKQGVSRKIEDEDQRRKMRDVMRQLDFPVGLGFILRTAGMGRTKRELQSDLNYLLRLWKRLVERVKRQPAPAPVYQESDLVTRTIRDVYTGEFSRVIVDEAETAKKVREFLKIATPRTKTPVELYTEREPLFHRFHIEEEIERINSRHVPLPSGGSLVIDSTEALVAIDVNSGRFRSPEDAEETALQINLEAAEEIARQLRLRDLGGLIVCDFIDMRPEKNQRAVEKALREALKRHKERARTLKMSAFGLIELTRQRRGPSMKRNLYADCTYCKGTGLVKMSESVMLDVMRSIQLATHHEHVYRIDITVSTDVAFELLNRKRALLHEIEKETGTMIRIAGDPNFTPDEMDCVCEDKRGSTVGIPALARQERASR